MGGFLWSGWLAGGITGGVTMFVAHAVRRSVAVLAVDTDRGAGNAVGLRNLAGHASAGLRRVRGARRNCRGDAHDPFPFRLDAAVI
jgi:hypothetical protein